VRSEGTQCPKALMCDVRGVQVGHAQMLKGGVIMDVMNPEQVRLKRPVCAS
jgi:pyridoxal biosynthesis lyase PdxS